MEQGSGASQRRPEAAAVDLLRLEPRVGALFERWHGHDESSYYAHAKAELQMLVGWYRRDPGPDLVFSSKAYELALFTLLDVMAEPVLVVDRDDIPVARPYCCALHRWGG